MLAFGQVREAGLLECRRMRRGLRRVASRLRRVLARHTRESPYYRNLTPCERGWYHRSNGAGASAHDNATVVITTTGGTLLETTLTFLDDSWPVYVIDGSHRCYGLPALHHALILTARTVPGP